MTEPVGGDRPTLEYATAAQSRARFRVLPVLAFAAGVTAVLASLTVWEAVSAGWPLPPGRPRSEFILGTCMFVVFVFIWSGILAGSLLGHLYTGRWSWRSHATLRGGVLGLAYLVPLGVFAWLQPDAAPPRAISVALLWLYLLLAPAALARLLLRRAVS